MLVRPTTRADVPYLKDFLYRILDAKTLRDIDLDTAINYREFSPESISLVCVYNDKVVGWVSSKSEKPGELTIAQLYVTPKYRRMGVATALMEHIRVNFANFTRIHMGVRNNGEVDRESLVQFYSRFGFMRRDVGPKVKMEIIH